MFDHIDLKRLSSCPTFGYAKDVPFFQGKKRVAFKPGLNILVGPNGSGKSTILKMLGESMCAVQGGTSTITLDAIQRGVDMMSTLGLGRKNSTAKTKAEPPDKVAVQVHHDGQGVIFCDPRQTVGLIGGSFDDDFFAQGITETMKGGRQSHGQSTMRRSGVALSVLNGNAAFPTEVRRSADTKNVNDVWQGALRVLEKRLVPRIPLGQPSILLDEPDANYSLAWQTLLWSRLADPAVAQRFQIIVASHSAFALGIRHAHYIDLAPGFRDQSEALLRQRFAPE